MDRDTVDTQLQQLLDRNEITDLVSRLGASLDEGRFDEMHSLFVEEATARTPGGAKEGREAVIAMARKNHRPEWGSEHVITNVLVDLEGDRASVRANLVVHSAPDGPPDLGTSGGTPDLGTSGGPSDRSDKAVPDGASATDGTVPPLRAPKVTFMLGEVYRFDVVRTADGWRFSRVDASPIWVWGTRPRAD